MSRRHWLPYGLFLCVGFVGAIYAAAPPRQPELVPMPQPVEPIKEGYYKVSGSQSSDDEDGNEKVTKYNGLVKIRKIGRQVYFVTWLIGDDPLRGLGVYNNGQLIVSWAKQLKGGLANGLSWYKVETPGRLRGDWILGPPFSEGSEILMYSTPLNIPEA